MFAGQIDDLLSRSARGFLVLGEAQLTVVDEYGRSDEALAVEPQAVVEAERGLLIGGGGSSQKDCRGSSGESS